MQYILTQEEYDKIIVDANLEKAKLVEKLTKKELESASMRRENDNATRLGEKVKELTSALTNLLSFTESIRNCQTHADVALMALKARSPLEGAHSALDAKECE